MDYEPFAVDSVTNANAVSEDVSETSSDRRSERLPAEAGKATAGVFVFWNLPKAATVASLEKLQGDGSRTGAGGSAINDCPRLEGVSPVNIDDWTRDNRPGVFVSDTSVVETREIGSATTTSVVSSVPSRWDQSGSNSNTTINEQVVQIIYSQTSLCIRRNLALDNIIIIIIKV